MGNFWDERYALKEFVYGKEANEFLSVQLPAIGRGKLLLPCEGEGRNAVYAATQMWEVDAFDQSEQGKSKCDALSRERKVQVNYRIADAMEFDYGKEQYDVIELIYTHFPPETRASIHSKCIDALKPGGVILLEAFNPLQLNNTSGGPKDEQMLFTEDILRSDFESLKTELLETVTTVLNEGVFHSGKADIVRYKGIKQSLNINNNGNSSRK
jgi:SAM-dependent methyltransferase